MTSHLTSYLHSRAAGQIGQNFDILVKVQEAYSNRLVSSFEKLAISQFEAKESKALEQKEDDMTQLKLGRYQQSDALGRILTQASAQSRASCESLPTCGQLTVKKRYDCRPGCSCPCHIKREISSPWLVNTLLGELNIYWRSQKPEVRCNCSGHKGLAVIYRFPRYLLQRYISMVLQTTYLDGPELVLRVPRVLPWTHLLWRYSVCGDLMAIKRMYADRLASPHDVDPTGRNALLYASKQQSAKVAEFLLDQGADSNQPDSLGRPPSEALLKRSFGGMYGENGSNIMRRILNSDDSFDEFGFTTLHKIVLGFMIKDLQTVLEATTDTVNTVDSIGRTALFWAVICDNTKHVRLLLHYGADPNAKDIRGFTPVDFVRGPSVCRLLLNAGATNNVNPMNHYHSSLHEQVIENGNVEVVSMLATAGFGFDMRDHDNETPLLNAIYAGHTAVVKLLIELGADVNNANIGSRDSALHFAASFDRPEILQLLLDAKADYTALDCNGRNLAHCAARASGTEFVKIMAGAGLIRLDLSLRDYEGKTPGDYMNERIVMTDLEVGVHEAWEELEVAIRQSLGSTSRGLNVEDVRSEEVHRFDGQDMAMLDQMIERPKVPGAFPHVSVQEIGVVA